MPSATDTRLVPLPDRALPGWCEPYLAPPDTGDFFAGRAWYDTVLAHALPAGAEPVLAVFGAGEAGLMAMLREAGRLRSLGTPYTLSWAPLWADHGPSRKAASPAEAGRALAGLLRGRAPTRLDAMDAVSPGMEEMLGGLRSAGLAVREYRHFGNWRERLAPGGGWDGYLAGRPPAMRSTILRKTARAMRDSRVTLVTRPGPALEDAIEDYHTIRDRSWKPPEPSPGFDAALMRAAAAIGALRLGVLHRRADGRPLAAQYWVVSGGCASLLKLSHDEAERAVSPGTALTATMIRGLIAEGGVTELDFGRGDDPYKQLWVSERRQRIGVTVTDPWHPSGLIELARQALGEKRRRFREWRQPAEAGQAERAGA